MDTVLEAFDREQIAERCHTHSTFFPEIDQKNLEQKAAYSMLGEKISAIGNVVVGGVRRV